MESSKDIETIAAALIARRDSGRWNAKDQEDLEEWLQLTAHRVAFVRLEAAWRQTPRLRAIAVGVRGGVMPPTGQYWTPAPFSPVRAKQTTLNLRHFSRTARLISARVLPPVILVLLSTIVFFPLRNSRSPVDSYHTDIGRVTAVPLSDGSRITLNTDSGIRVAVTEDERDVELERGEAFFEVAKDARRPFVVTVGDRRITAVGTKFAIKRDAQDIEVKVTEGLVRVELVTSSANEPMAHLWPGTVAHANGAGLIVESKPLPEVEDSLSWRSGFLVFHETPLATAAAQFNRYNTRKLIIEDAAVANLQIGGTFRASNVSAFARLLGLGFPIEVSQDAQQIRLKLKPAQPPSSDQRSSSK